MKAEKLTRFGVGAADETRAKFGRSLLDALDRLGVAPGQEFLIAPVQEQASLMEEPQDDDRMGPFTADSDTSRKAALDNYPRSGSQRHRVLMALHRAGPLGATRDELATKLQLPDSGTDARVWELKGGEFVIEDDVRTRTTRAGSEASVLVLTEKGRKLVREHGDDRD